MRKILLTSAGFENKKIEEKFLELVNIEKEEIKVLFIPTAAISDGAKAFAKECRKEIIDVGILDENVITFDLDREITFEEVNEFHVIYFSGGTTEHLLKEVNRTGFNEILNAFVDNGGVYVGVSAGSIIATRTLDNNLGYVNCILKVHCLNGSKSGVLDTENRPIVELTDNQAILVVGDSISIIE